MITSGGFTCHKSREKKTQENPKDLFGPNGIPKFCQYCLLFISLNIFRLNSTTNTTTNFHEQSPLRIFSAKKNNGISKKMDRFVPPKIP